MAIDVSSLDSGTPRTLDGRVYPEHLRPYEDLDAELLPLAAELGRFTFDELTTVVADPKVRAVLPHWLSSAEWRALVARRDASMHSPREYEVSARGHDALLHLG
jgi:hypothetical protein